MSPGRDGVFIGLDLGTSGVRAMAIDAQGTPLADRRCALRPRLTGQPGRHEQAPADWWSCVCNVLSGLPLRLRQHARALSIDGTSGTLLLSDTGGKPLTGALMYDDSRGGEFMQGIRAAAPPRSPTRNTGSALARLLYLLDRRATGSDCLALHQADWVAGRLLERYGASDENNALKLGYDPVQGCWPDWLRGLLPDNLILPQVNRPGTALGTICAHATRLTGLPRELLIVAGTTDSNAAALASGIGRPGDAVTSLGSTLVLKVVSRQPVADSRYGVYSQRLGDRWLAGGASNSGGMALLRYFSNTEIRLLSARLRPQQPCMLDYYPLPGIGERFPLNDPKMRSRVSPRPADKACFFQAMLEGIARIETEGDARLHQLGAPYPERVLSAGGGADNRAWGKIRARLLGVPEQKAPHTEAAYGSALLARGAIDRE